MTVMVAIALNTEPLFETASHARGHDRSCNRSSSSRTNSVSHVNLREAAYGGCDRLGTCSKDPVDPAWQLAFQFRFTSIAKHLWKKMLGFEIGESAYEFCGNAPINYVDSTGRERIIIDQIEGGGGRNRTRRTCKYPENACKNGKYCLLECRSKDQSKPPTTNGCTTVGQSVFGFTLACNNHDLCWGTCGADHDSCDVDFYSDMVSICDDRYDDDSFWEARCVQAAYVYLRSVSLMSSYFEATQDEFCKWKPCPSETWKLAPWDEQEPPFQDRHPDLDPSRM